MVEKDKKRPLFGGKGPEEQIMEAEIREFMEYLSQERQASKNTQMSYRRDLDQMEEYLKEQGIVETKKVTRTLLNSYILYLESQGRAATTISRMMASMKAFFHYEFSRGKDQPRSGGTSQGSQSRKESPHHPYRGGGDQPVKPAWRLLAQGAAG